MFDMQLNGLNGMNGWFGETLQSRVVRLMKLMIVDGCIFFEIDHDHFQEGDTVLFSNL
jgi:hypothetical protein